MLYVLNMFIDLYICYTDHLWQDEDLVPNEIGEDQGSMVYPLVDLRIFSVFRNIL